MCPMKLHRNSWIWFDGQMASQRTFFGYQCVYLWACAPSGRAAVPGHGGIAWSLTLVIDGGLFLLISQALTGIIVYLVSFYKKEKMNGGEVHMLFNSYIFVLAFLPLCITGYFLLNRLKTPLIAQIFLLGMSLWFYAWFNVSYLLIILISILINYGLYKILTGGGQNYSVLFC